MHIDALLHSLRHPLHRLSDDSRLLQGVLLSLGLALVAQELRVHLFHTRGRWSAQAFGSCFAWQPAKCTEPATGDHPPAREPAAVLPQRLAPAALASPPCEQPPVQPGAPLRRLRLRGGCRRQRRGGRGGGASGERGRRENQCRTHPLGGDPPHARRLLDAVSVRLVVLVVVGVVLRLGHRDGSPRTRRRQATRAPRTVVPGSDDGLPSESRGLCILPFSSRGQSCKFDCPCSRI